MEVVFALEEDMRQFPEELRKRKWSASEEWTDRRKRPSTRSRETRYPQVDDRDERAFETFECIPSQNEGTLGSLG